jgi:hypothetical protein
MRNHQDGFGDVANLGCCEARLVFVDQRDDIPTRHVAVIDDGEAGPIEVVADVCDLSGRHGRSDRPNVEDIVKPDIVDITRQARDLLVTFFPENVASDGTALRHT